MKRIAILMLAAVLASACKKEGHRPQLAGTYTGSFQVTPFYPTNQPGGPFPVQLIISGTNFSSGKDPDYITVGGGSLKINKGDINFTDNQEFPQNTLFNSAAVLYDAYTYSIKGDSLLLSKTALGVTYIYKFKKQ